MIEIKVDVLNISASDLMYAANMLAKIAQDKQAVIDQQTALVPTSTPTEKTNEEVKTNEG